MTRKPLFWIAFVAASLVASVGALRLFSSAFPVVGLEIRMEAEAHPALSIELDDLYLAGEPVEIRAKLINVTQETGPLEARIEPLAGICGDIVEARFKAKGDTSVLRMELPAGLYRATIETSKGGPAAPPAVHDVFEVAG